MQQLHSPSFSPHKGINPTSKKKYQCTCGSTFSRSDVLLRHIRTCAEAKGTLERNNTGSGRMTRSKKACNRCAASKLKCNFQKPCQRCLTKSLECEYTRKGYSDCYEVFQLQKSNAQAINYGNVMARQDQTPSLFGPQVQVNDSSLATSLQESPDDDVIEITGIGMNLSFDYVNASFLSGYVPTGMDVSLEDVDWDSLLTLPEWTENLDNSIHTPEFSSIIAPRAEPDEAAWAYTDGLQLQQIDSVEGKCVEIRDYLRNNHTGFDYELMLTHVTRDTLVTCVQLYGKYYQSIQPILHLPTFDLVKTSPVLLVAMMLVGGCYSNNVIPPAVILQCAIHVLILIETSSHERAMRVPPLAIIQANTLLCQLLICTKDIRAFQFSTMHRARTFSMAERAGLFTPTEQIDYLTVNDETFDWKNWIELEMRRRLAYHIFIDDIGGSIFTQASSHMSPLTLRLDTPCYQSSWVAPTASKCLRSLQKLPMQIQVATAIKRVRSATIHDTFLFDTSDCGMLEIIISLHGILFRAMEESLDHEDNIPQQSEYLCTHITIPNLSLLLHRDLLNHNVANIANDVVAKYGSGAMTRANDALNAWRRNWDVRRTQDIYNDDKSSAFSHPVNFWLLAKLFVVLHFFRNHPGSTTQEKQNQEFMAFYYAKDGTAAAKLKVQLQVIDWLSRIRQRRDEEPLSAESFLSQVINIQ